MERGDESLSSGIKIEAPDSKGAKESLPRAAVARAEWQDLLDKEGLKDAAKIQTARAERLKKVEELKKAAGETKKEAWINNPKNEGGWPEGLVKGRIESKLDDALKDKLGQIKEFGLSEPAIETFKTAVVDHIYDCYKKNNNDDNATENYVNTGLLPKATFLFEGLTKIYQSKVYPFANAFDCLQKFNNFSGLNFIQGDNFSLTGLQKLMETDQNSYQVLVTNFGNALQPMREAEQLEKALKSLPSNGQEQQPAENRQVSQSPQQPPSTPEIQPTTPNAPASAPTEAPKAQAEKPASAPAEQPKPPVAAANLPTSPTAPSTKPIVAPAARSKAEDEMPIKTGYSGLDKAIKILFDLFEKIKPYLIQFGIMSPDIKPQNLLTPKELEEAKQLETVLKEAPYKFPDEIIKKIFEDQKQLKAVLDAKNEKKLDWPTYVAKHLDATEHSDIKNNSSLKPEEMIARFLSENPKPPVSGDPTFEGPAA